MSYRIRLALAIFMATCIVFIANAANNVPFATFGGTRTVFKTTDTGGVHVPHVNVDIAADTGGVSNADDVANGTGFGRVQAFNYVYDGAAWDRASPVGTSNAGVTISTNVPGFQGVTGGVPVPVVLSSEYPSGATAISATATGTTAATTATLAAAANKTTYICGLSIRANATAAATGNATVTGTVTATLNYTQWTAPAASGIGIIERTFTPCLPASAVNTAIAVISAAPGVGGVVSVTSSGYQL